MEEILKEYQDYLFTAPFEVLDTKKLGWIIVRTDYQAYSNPVKQISSPEELRAYIVSQIG